MLTGEPDAPARSSDGEGAAASVAGDSTEAIASAGGAVIMAPELVGAITSARLSRPIRTSRAVSREGTGTDRLRGVEANANEPNLGLL